MLADPRSPSIRDHLNANVKFREAFRPFAPSVLNEHAAAWFGLADSPFMLRASPVLRGDVPAVTHVDGTSRIQTVEHDDNPDYHALIERFRHLTGVPLVLNTSLNTKGLPIDETPQDALSTLLDTDMDALVFPGLIIGKHPG
jgi:carbamoyltransferase